MILSMREASGARGDCRRGGQGSGMPASTVALDFGMELAPIRGMKFPATDVLRIASQAAHDVSADLSVTGATTSGGDTGYSEVHITVVGCHVEPCHFVLSVFRDVSEEALRREITTSLRTHLEQRTPRTTNTNL
jgi:hypothetical protein